MRLASRSCGQEVADDEEQLEVFKRWRFLTRAAHIFSLNNQKYFDEKLFKHWKDLVKKTGGELEFPKACSGVIQSTRELVDRSTKSITFFTTVHTLEKPKWVTF